MNKNKYILFCYTLLLSSWQCCSAFYSLKELSSWALGYKQETLHKEIPCDHSCTLYVENSTGSIYIKTWSLPKITLQAIKTAREKDLDNIIINTQTTHNEISIKTTYADKQHKGEVDYYIMTPANLNLMIITQNGSIKIKNIKGTVEAKVNTGTIEITNAVNNLFLKNLYGPITISMKELISPTHLMVEASSLIQLHLPQNANADIYAKAPTGTITSQHYLTLKPITTKLNQHAWSSFKREVNGTLGKGGAQIHLYSSNGHIKLAH